MGLRVSGRCDSARRMLLDSGGIPVGTASDRPDANVVDLVEKPNKRLSH